MDHKNNQNYDSWMMWVMMICCVAPLGVLFLAGKGLDWRSDGQIIIAVAIMLVLHFWLMRKTCHKKELPEKEEQKTD